MILKTVWFTLSLIVMATNALGSNPGGFQPSEALIKELAESYRAGDAESLDPHLASGMVFQDLGLHQKANRQQFLDMVRKNQVLYPGQKYNEIWVTTAKGYGELRGIWTAFTKGRPDQIRRNASIEFHFDPSGKIIRWVDDFRIGRIFKPVNADGNVKTDHFTITYNPGQLDANTAERLGKTAEAFYEKTANYLGKELAAGFQLPLNVSDIHASPYASDPGPDGFILVPLKSAKRVYGFSMVHEFTHYLLGLSKATQKRVVFQGERQSFGNRLLDEGFGVFVEEKLTETPRVFPNFGKETHEAYWQLRRNLEKPIWPIVQAEYYRSHPSQREMTRLAYLQQGSFCKYLVETYGLEKFLALFKSGLDGAEDIYGKTMEDLDKDWRTFLEARFR